ncbi:MAG: DNA replication/repair protein RecF [bacterium]|nr:DNA replication/repair protein RecF [bacterium]
MRYLDLRSEGFRNLAPFSLEFHPEVNWLYGANGQGKTNFLESLLYLVSGRSFRLSRDEDLINFDSDHFFIKGHLKDDGDELLSFTASCARNGGKRLKINEDEIGRLAELVSLTGTVVFGPTDVALVTGEPENRRRFLDYTLSKTDPGYLSNLMTYKRVLKQRNALLRDRVDGGHLAVWTEKLVDCGAEIILRRRENLLPINDHAANFYQDMSGAEELLKLSYTTKIPGRDKVEIKAEFAEKLKELAISESLKKRTLAGPHRDDMLIDIKGRNARKFASQGQKRSAAIALKLAQAEYLAQTRRDRPIVFLDDVFSELDQSRREKLCLLVGRKYQTFLASPQLEDLRNDLFGDFRRFRVDCGCVTLES